jgi:hypothetical protein
VKTLTFANHWFGRTEGKGYEASDGTGKVTKTHRKTELHSIEQRFLKNYHINFFLKGNIIYIKSINFLIPWAKKQVLRSKYNGCSTEMRCSTISI